MKVLKAIIDFIMNPVKKIISHISFDAISKYVSKHSYVIYISAFALTGLLFGLFYYVL